MNLNPGKYIAICLAIMTGIVITPDLAAQHPDQLNQLENYNSSTGQIIFNASYTCTGVLINNTRDQGRPLMLTAAHCIENEQDLNSIVVIFGKRKLLKDQAFDGVILVSPFLNFPVGVDGAGEDLPHVLYFPTLAATAWYHDAIDDKPADLAAFYEAAKRFAVDVYGPALMKGNRLGAEERSTVITGMSEFLGVSEDYIERANLRISHQQFAQELLRDRKLTAGRIDSRFTGNSLNLLGEEMDYDPMFTSVRPAFVSNFLDYYHNDLKFGRDKDYKVSGGLFMKWDWGHAQPGSSFTYPSPNTMPDLSRAMNDNPELRVLVQQGYYDLATPAFATEYMMDHLTIAEKFDADIRIVAICDLYKGSIADPEGLDPQALLDHIIDRGDLNEFPAPDKGWGASETIELSGANVLVELSYTDLKTGEPALSHMIQALSSGMNVSTTNKGPAALHFPKLLELCKTTGTKIGVEGTVMSGTPTLALGMNMLTAGGVTRIQGILNGTTNYILGEMEKGADYADALKDAQEKGYAEADPSGDVDGHDAAAKIVILANLMMAQSMTMEDVSCIGISRLSRAKIQSAQAENHRWKLIGTLENVNGRIQGSVKPVKLDAAHPLYGVGGATNAITFSTDLLGDITLIGPGAGRIETGYAIIGDILSFSHQS
jgi:homoserine dehydrogenase